MDAIMDEATANIDQRYENLINAYMNSPEDDDISEDSYDESLRGQKIHFGYFIVLVPLWLALLYLWYRRCTRAGDEHYRRQQEGRIRRRQSRSTQTTEEQEREIQLRIERISNELIVKKWCSSKGRAVEVEKELKPSSAERKDTTETCTSTSSCGTDQNDEDLQQPEKRSVEVVSSTTETPNDTVNPGEERLGSCESVEDDSEDRCNKSSDDLNDPKMEEKMSRGGSEDEVNSAATGDTDVESARKKAPSTNKVVFKDSLDEDGEHGEEWSEEKEAGAQKDLDSSFDDVEQGKNKEEEVVPCRPECAICLEAFENGQKVCQANNIDCRHVFHHECMMEWLRKNDSCPVCRTRYLGIEEFANNDTGSPPSVASNEGEAAVASEPVQMVGTATQDEL